MTQMRAAITGRYGPPEVVRIEQVLRPVAKAGDVLIRVAAAPVSSGDARIRGFEVPKGFGLPMRLIFGLRGPRWPVMGMEFAGRVVVGGASGGPFPAGERVFGLTGLKGGAHAEYLVLPGTGKLLPIPASLTDVEAAGFFFGGLTAADFLIDKARLQPGERILIHGATGAVGSAAVQIARHLGAQVSAVCSGANLEFARGIGAHQAFDYRAGPVEGTFDVVLDVIGSLPYRAARANLTPGGRYGSVTATLAQQVEFGLRPRRGGHHRIAGVIADGLPAMLRLIAIHGEGGYRPIIGATFPFDRIREAHAIAGSFHKRGNCVVVMDAAP